ncbi:MAG: hypothetical protein MUE79_00260 [Nitratireductor sp.]|nr:hypothetical protein [Nitratireductor sp.]
MPKHAARFAAIAVTATISLAGTSPAPAQEKPEDIIATQLRDQGFACENPRDAVQDASDSRPDEEAWTIQCDGQKYRIRFVPDMAAQIEKID